MTNLRQIAVSGVVSALVLILVWIAALCFGALGLKADVFNAFTGFVVDAGSDLIKALLKLFRFEPESKNTPKWVGVVAAWLLLAALIFVLPLVKRLTLILASPFDTSVFEGIRHRTGLLRWQLYRDGSKALPQPTLIDEFELAQAVAWDALRKWVFDGCGDGTLKPFWRKRPIPRAFTWAVLVSPNGLGKSQLAYELGRTLARRDCLGDAARDVGFKARYRQWRHRLSVWLRHLAWWKALRDDDPWDAGILYPLDAPKRKNVPNWRPRRPTLILLDDPATGSSSEVIRILSANSAEFLYPVRLLILDQLLPADLAGTQPDSHDSVASNRGMPEPVVIRDFGFTRRNAIGLRIQEVPGREGQGQVAPISSEALGELLDRTGPWPLAVALALHFLSDKGKDSVATLAEQERHLAPAAERGVAIPHRVIEERVADLQQTIKSIVPGHMDLLRALACATLANGLPRVELGKNGRQTTGRCIERFQLGNVADSMLRQIFPHAMHDLKNWLPPIRPLEVGLVFIRQLLSELHGPREEALDKLISDAWELNPEGTLNTLRRLAGSSDEIATRLAESLQSRDPAEALRIALAHCEIAIRSGGSTETALARLDAAWRLQ